MPPSSAPRPPARLDRGHVEALTFWPGCPTRISFCVGRCGTMAAGTPDFHTFGPRQVRWYFGTSSATCQLALLRAGALPVHCISTPALSHYPITCLENLTRCAALPLFAQCARPGNQEDKGRIGGTPKRRPASLNTSRLPLPSHVGHSCVFLKACDASPLPQIDHPPTPHPAPAIGPDFNSATSRFAFSTPSSRQTHWLFPLSPLLLPTWILAQVLVWLA